MLLLAAAAAVVLGVVTFAGGGSAKSRAKITPLVNADVLEAIDRLQVSDYEKEQLRQQAITDQIEFWQFTVHGSKGASSEVYTVSTDLATHSYTVTEHDQEFILWATKGSVGFAFNAVADNQIAGMLGEWITPMGTFPFDMRPGAALTIPVR